jgi:hypothetical protein
MRGGASDECADDVGGRRDRDRGMRSSDSATSSPQEEQLPAESQLCKLTVGYDLSAGSIIDTPVIGTHSDDVRAVLGEPAKRSDTEFTYEWCVGDGCVKKVSAVFTFEKLDRCYRDTGKPIAPPYWLSDAKAVGFTFPKCWVVGSEMRDNCPEYLDAANVTNCDK